MLEIQFSGLQAMSLLKSLFTTRDPKREATSAVTRLINIIDAEELKYSQGLVGELRKSRDRYATIGVWIIPLKGGQAAENMVVPSAVPAVTHDLRVSGLGIVAPAPLAWKEAVVALPMPGKEPEDEIMMFLRVEIRHCTRKTGGWYAMGMELQDLLKPDSAVLCAFRKHTELVSNMMSNS